MNDIAQMLNRAGLKATPQRIAIYSMLKNTDEHPTVEKIYNSVTKNNPTISIATVYKTLDSFVKCGIIQEINVSREYSNYDSRTDNHPHIMCTCCKKVCDLEPVDDSDIRSEISKKTGFIINDEQTVYYGLCPECQKKSK